MLPQAEIVFLDEVFKANSAILNSLLSVLNERVYTVGGSVWKTPLISAFGASNEVPNDEDLMAVFDRFLLRVHAATTSTATTSKTCSPEGPANALEVAKIAPAASYSEPLQPVLSAEAAARPPAASSRSCMQLVAGGLSRNLQGPRLSDPRRGRVMSATGGRSSCSSSSRPARCSTGEAAPDNSDFFILRHIWNNLDQSEILDGIVGTGPRVAHYREHPEAASLRRSRRRHGRADRRDQPHTRTAHRRSTD